ncbi:MAG: hypothetical protein HOK28_12050 [Deltaproteobacteria bacterium]|nr:hypothetical protein [Deltaproteobacteria bacterium]
MKLNALTSMALIVALGLFTACGGEDTAKEGADNTEATTETTDTTDANTDATDDTTDNNTTDNNTDIGGNDSGNSSNGPDCLQQGAQCFECFAQADMGGYQAYEVALSENCLCANECVTECTAECGGQQGDGACQQCLNTLPQGSSCQQDFSAACQGNNVCLSFAMNVQNCPQ